MSLDYPLTISPRIAVLGLSLRLPPNARAFRGPDDPYLELFQPESIAAPFDDFGRLPQDVQTGLRMPLVLFSFPDTGLLTKSPRDWLWHHFGLPVYEQLRDRDGRLLAFECSAHRGLHVVQPADLDYATTEEACFCGRTGLRYLRPAHERTRLASSAA